MVDELSPAAHRMFAKELVLVCDNGAEMGTLYTHEEFLGAFQDAILHRLSASIPAGASARTAMRTLARMRSPEAHKATLVDTLARLKTHGHPVDPETLTGAARRVVAVFPANA